LLQIFDNEFTYVGPASFDLGMLLANYIICYYAHMLTPEDNDAHRQVSYKMLDACKKTGTYDFVPSVMSV
jgi:5-methylthioribose kinase